MEYCEGGNLLNYLSEKKQLTENESRAIFQQIIDAIYYLHQVGVCHRNLNLENILFSSKKRDKIKIIDFKFSKLYLTGVNSENPTLAIGAEFLETPGGTPGYIPPEVILGCKYDGLLSDIWSCGIILYAIICGCLPFEDNNVDIMYTKTIKGEFSYPNNINISKEAQKLINKILVVNPRLRSSIIDIRNDNWFMKDYSQNFGLYISIRDIPYDNKIIEYMEKYGFRKNDIIKSIKDNKHNNITAFYYILVNKYEKEGINSISDLISNEFKEYLIEQDLKNNLVKKGEKPISLKIIKSNSKPVFDINEKKNETFDEKIDLDYLKNIFKEYENSEINTKKRNKDKNYINKINIYPITNNNNINNNKIIKSTNIILNIKKKSKSQNNKNINKKNEIINDRYHSTSLNKRFIKKNKKEENKKKQASSSKKNNKKRNILNNAIKQINNIKNVIKKKNKTIFNDFKNSISFIPKDNKTQKNLKVFSTSNSKSKKNSSINRNIFTINNESKLKINKIKNIKDKNIKNNKTKRRSLNINNKYINNNKEKLVFSRNRYPFQLNEFNDPIKTTRNFNHKYIINSASNSKSKSIKSISNYSYPKRSKILSKNDSKNKIKKNYFNIKINVMKPSLLNLNKENKDIIMNNSKNKVLKTKNKIKEIKSISTSKSKNNNNIINKKNKNIATNKLFNNINTQNKDDKNEIKENSSKNKSFNKIIKKINTKNKNNNIVDIKNNSIKYPHYSKVFSNNLQQLIQNVKEVSPIKMKINTKKSSNNLVNRDSMIKNQNKPKIEISKIINKNKVIKNIKTLNDNLKKRENTNNFNNKSSKKKISPKNIIKKNKDENRTRNNKIKIKEYRSIKVFNIPINDFC